MRWEDKTIRATPLEEEKGDKEVIPETMINTPEVDTKTEGEVALETETTGLERLKDITMIAGTKKGLAQYVGEIMREKIVP